MAGRKTIPKAKPIIDDKPLDIAMWANHEPAKKKRNYKPLIVFILIVIIACVWFLCGYELGIKQGFQISELCQ